MALDMSNVSVGRSDDQGAMYSTMHSILYRLVRNFTGDEYKNVISVIRANWVGDDADAFIINFETKIAKLQKQLPNKYASLYTNKILENNKTFANAQARNQSMLKF